MTNVAAGRPRRRAELPSPQLVAVTVGTTVAAAIALVIVTAAFPIDRAIAPPFTIGTLDPILIGLAIWIGVALATSSRSVTDEGRVTIIYGVGPIVGAWALGGPAAGVWVALLGTFELREFRGQIPWYGVVANHAMQVVPAAIGGTLTLVLRDAAAARPGEAADLIAVLAGAVVFWVLGLVLAMATIWARNGRTPKEALGIPGRTIVAMIGAESALAWVFSLSYHLIAWWSPVVFVLADVAASGSLDRARAGWLTRHHQITRLPNRTALAERAQDLRRSGRRTAYVFYLDLDGFKSVNEDYDHDTGDAVLRVVAERLSAARRHDDFLAHFHGDEFVLLASGVTSDEDAEAVIVRLTAAVEVPIELPEGTIRVSASIGYHVITDLRSIDEEIRHADRRMTVAKRDRAEASGRVRRVG
jgi:diguanylate cyclase (GGDEF)-like protein